MILTLVLFSSCLQLPEAPTYIILLLFSSSLFLLLLLLSTPNCSHSRRTILIANEILSFPLFSSASFSPSSLILVYPVFSSKEILTILLMRTKQIIQINFSCLPIYKTSIYITYIFLIIYSFSEPPLTTIYTVKTRFILRQMDEPLSFLLLFFCSSFSLI